LEFLFAPWPLGIIPPLQCDPWPWRAAAPAQIPALQRGNWAGKVGRGIRGSPWFDPCPELGSRWPRGRRAAVAGGASRDCPTVGEVWRLVRLHGVSRAPRGPSEGGGMGCGWGTRWDRGSLRRRP
jgi:hypothetical protein